MVAKLEGQEKTYLDVVGIDLFAPHRIRGRSRRRISAETLASPGWAAVTRSWRGSRVGTVGHVEVSSGSRKARLTVGALVDFRKLAPAARPRQPS